MSLAAPLTARKGEVSSYWYGPDCWYLVSDTVSAADLIASCTSELEGVLHGERVDVDRPIDVLLGKGHEQIPGTDNHIRRLSGKDSHAALDSELSCLRDQASFSAVPLEYDKSRTNLIFGFSEEPNVVYIASVSPQIL